MYSIEFFAVLSAVFQGVTLDECEWVVLLRLDIYASHVEASAGVTHSCTAGPAEQIEQSRFHRFGLLSSGVAGY